MSAFIFDLDDTLYDPLEPFKKAYQKHLTMLHPVVAVEDFYKVSRAYSDALFEAQQNGEIPIEEVRRIRIQSAAKDFGFHLSAELADAFQTTYAKGQGELVLLPGYETFFKECQSKNIFLGVITNGPGDLQRKKLASLSLERYIPSTHWLISGEVGLMKPQREIFAYYYQQHQAALTDKKIYYIGDSFENDVVGANRMHWQALWLNHRKRQPITTDESLSYKEFTTLDSLLTYCKNQA
ncbi:HAD family hydrolase [Enterococcus columbae]|uniref:HAD superfamily hydrolase n=1 Tax=Enterococcus columbae DSM 7374 = ATCC 51263 TaxID=1121865 RepID=S1NFH7_9ENTE|nr:HAD family hydrolase [Enterococcus columbae]EOT38557.1 hypothetical protein OMW_02197 [Enterococcus columbae DSM 7374 = ATCC 51263]EOW87792.1 hypothetical protein I568_00078 [Enterococcus columbae DSM 7374 = ATCC 51263]OJG22672.1 hypothetical protein RR47_GL000766 [Enterococcus columbae DSM 7374 = ATCC 51263]